MRTPYGSPAACADVIDYLESKRPVSAAAALAALRSSALDPATAIREAFTATVGNEIQIVHCRYDFEASLDAAVGATQRMIATLRDFVAATRAIGTPALVPIAYPDDYASALHVLALALAFSPDEETFATIAEALGPADSLIDDCLEAYAPGRQRTTWAEASSARWTRDAKQYPDGRFVFWSKEYGAPYEALAAPAPHCAEGLAKHHRKWLVASQRKGFHDQPDDPQESVSATRWFDWHLLLPVLAFGADDSGVRSDPHYPRDAADHARTRWPKRTGLARVQPLAQTVKAARSPRGRAAADAAPAERFLQSIAAGRALEAARRKLPLDPVGYEAWADAFGELHEHGAAVQVDATDVEEALAAASAVARSFGAVDWEPEGDSVERVLSTTGVWLERHGAVLLEVDTGSDTCVACVVRDSGDVESVLTAARQLRLHARQWVTK